VPELALSTTSYAILGYLAIRPWSGYELAKQLGRTFHHFWPRAESGIYREMKRLGEAGLATAAGEAVGRRARTRYDITPAGHAALLQWLSTPRSDGFLESEGMVRLLFADHGTKEALSELLQVMVRDAGDRGAQMEEFVRDYLVGRGQFPRRSHINVLVAKFLIDFADMVRDWAAWSQAFIDTWPDVAERAPDEVTLAKFREVLASREWQARS
jgi:PadR family transcriptional regulator, regulatory protein AphA